MSTMRTGDWLSYLLADKAGTAKLPEDPFTPTTGGNGGLDGYDFDTPYNEGVLHQEITLPDNKVAEGDVPDDFFTAPADPMLDMITTEAAEALDLTRVLGDDEPEACMDKVASGEGLEWLDPTQAQDPDRLPEVVNAIQTKRIDDVTFFSGDGTTVPELEEAWGSDRRTDGLRLVPNKDKEILDYEQSLTEDQKSGLPGGDEKTDKVKTAILRAMRRSAYGDPLADIKQEMVATLGNDAKFARRAMQIVEAEHGLVGNVFIRAAAFPGIRRGNWTKLLKKVAKTARYIIDAKLDPRLGTMLGMEVVQEVPWKAAFKHYSMLLAPLGYKLASQPSDPREALRRAFLSGPAAPKPRPTNFPVDVRPADTISRQAAFQQFNATAAQEIAHLSNAHKALARARAATMQQLSRWMSNGLLHPEDYSRLAASEADPRAVLRTGAALIARSGKTASYEGVGTLFRPVEANLTPEQVWAAFADAERVAAEQKSAFDASQRQKVAKYLDRMVRQGLIWAKDAKAILARNEPPHKLMEMAAAVAQAAWTRQAEMPAAQKAAEYQGPTFEAAQHGPTAPRALSASEQRVLAAARAGGVQASEIKRLLKWAHVTMTEGSAGQELDIRLAARFGKPVLAAGYGLLKELRARHEGLTGFLYVDAAAYASPTGTTGCDKGALQHRANALKFVLAMDRCATCALAVGGRCEKYGKKLVAGAPVDDPKAYQKKAIHMANAGDAEMTASLFAPSYDPSEYDLTDPMSSITLEETPTTEALGDILFDGGLELE